MASNLQVDRPIHATAQAVRDQAGNTSALALATDKVGVGTTNPTQRLTLGSGNLLLPVAKAGVDGNLYFGGTTDTGEIGMRLFGGKINDQFQSGFIDVRAGTEVDGLIFRVDTSHAGVERMRITASGNVGIGTAHPEAKLHAKGLILFDLSHSGGGRLLIGNNPNDNKVFLEGLSSDGKGHASEMLITGRFAEPLPVFTIRADTTHFSGDIVTEGDICLNNADCAEDFDICETEPIEPGMVMVLGEDGKLQPSHMAYDKRVAGVVSGAGEYKPGIVLDKRATANVRQPIALLGKVFCKADAQYGAIDVGDLLTTAPTRGHAMKAGDPLKAFGTVLGKALRPLTAGQGLIPILVALQ